MTPGEGTRPDWPLSSETPEEAMCEKKYNFSTLQRQSLDSLFW